MPQSHPMYQHIADDLRDQISNGRARAQREATDRRRAERPVRGSRNTVRDAIRRLTDEGLLETRPGHGTFVTTKVDPFVTVLTADPKAGFGGGETAATFPRCAKSTGCRRARSRRSRW